MDNKQTVISEQFLSQNPLFWSGQGPIVVNNERTNVFLGAGVATPDELSQAIPIDSLGFLLSAEFVKRRLPNSQVFLLIADQHAWLSNRMEEKSSRQIADRQEKIFAKIISSLNLTNWDIFRASQLFPKSFPESYENLERRDVAHFFLHHGIGIKIGWKFSAKTQVHKTDEAHFDQMLNFPIASIFIKPGITLDSTKPLESPYICTDPSKRILLSQGEKVAEKLDSGSALDNQRHAVQNQLKRITMLFERVVKVLPDGTPVEKKAKIILNKIFS